jgi:hypothetical protein
MYAGMITKDEIKTFPKDVKVILVVMSADSKLRCLEYVGGSALAKAIDHLVTNGSEDIVVEQEYLIDPQGNDVYRFEREFLVKFMDVHNKLGSWDYVRSTILPALFITDTIKFITLQ